MDEAEKIKLFLKILATSMIKQVFLQCTHGYNPKKPGKRCHNIQFAFCDELKAYITGFIPSGNPYTAHGAAEMIKEIVAQIKMNDLEILFRMDSGYFDEKINGRNYAKLKYVQP